MYSRPLPYSDSISYQLVTESLILLCKGQLGLTTLVVILSSFYSEKDEKTKDYVFYTSSVLGF